MGKLRINDKTKRAILTVLLLVAVAVVSLVLTMVMTDKAKTARTDERGGRAASVQAMTETESTKLHFPELYRQYLINDAFKEAEGQATMEEAEAYVDEYVLSECYDFDTTYFNIAYDWQSLTAVVQVLETSFKVADQSSLMYFQLKVFNNDTGALLISLYWKNTLNSQKCVFNLDDPSRLVGEFNHDDFKNVTLVIDGKVSLDVGCTKCGSTEHMGTIGTYVTFDADEDKYADGYEDGKNSVTPGITEDELNVAIEAARAEGYAAGLEEASAEDFLLDFKLFKLDAKTSFIVIVSFLGVSAAIVVLLALAGLGIVVKKLRK